MLVLIGWVVAHAHAAPEAMARLAPRDALAMPDVQGRWVRPSATQPAQPVWGHADGLRVGLHPMPGPRGLLRIYAPYLGHDDGRVINFIAVEPIRQGQQQRGYSELERSRLDGVRGKRCWSTNDVGDQQLHQPDHPARGIIEKLGHVELLRVFVQVEQFENGAAPCLRLTFRSDRPHEVGIAVFSQRKSAPMVSCIVTATMGNYARLRQLHLANRQLLARDLWPDYHGNAFTPHARFPLKDLFRTPDGQVLVAATTDEKQPQQAHYAPGTALHWRYTGKVATQYWRSEKPDPAMLAAVNGRFTYWLSDAPIPGGIAFENFELVQPHSEGTEVWFGVTPRTPAELGLSR